MNGGKWTTVRILRETSMRLKEIAGRTGMTMDEIITALLNAYGDRLYETNLQTQPDIAPEIAPQQEMATVAIAEEKTLTETEIQAPTQIVDDVLYVLEPVIDALTEIVKVYPDLRAEAGLQIAQAQTRFLEIARKWGLIETETPETIGQGET